MLKILIYYITEKIMKFTDGTRVNLHCSANLILINNKMASYQPMAMFTQPCTWYFHRCYFLKDIHNFPDFPFLSVTISLELNISVHCNGSTQMPQTQFLRLD